MTNHQLGEGSVRVTLVATTDDGPAIRQISPYKYDATSNPEASVSTSGTSQLVGTVVQAPFFLDSPAEDLSRFYPDGDVRVDCA